MFPNKFNIEHTNDGLQHTPRHPHTRIPHQPKDFKDEHYMRSLMYHYGINLAQPKKTNEGHYQHGVIANRYE